MLVISVNKLCQIFVMPDRIIQVIMLLFVFEKFLIQFESMYI